VNEEVKEFIAKMPNNEAFNAMDEDDKEKVIFASSEYLKANYGRWRALPSTAIAFQVLYDIESQSDHYMYLKRQNVQSFSTKGISVTFKDTDAISPEVRGILGNPPKARSGRTGRLI
jgi:hypothetical protein